MHSEDEDEAVPDTGETTSAFEENTFAAEDHPFQIAAYPAAGDWKPPGVPRGHLFVPFKHGADFGSDQSTNPDMGDTSISKNTTWQTGSTAETLRGSTVSDESPTEELTQVQPPCTPDAADCDRRRRRMGRVEQVDVRLLEDMEPRWRISELKPPIAKFLESKWMVISSVVLTLWALIGDDIRLATTDKTADNYFNVLVLICLVYFMLELVLASFAKEDYFLGFFFYLDTCSTLSLIMDLTWVFDALISEQSLDSGVADRARSGRTAKAGASVGRMVRVLRLIRIVKLYKAYFDNPQDQPEKKPADSLEPGEFGDEDQPDEEDEDDELNRESLVGKKLSALTIRRLICLVIAMMSGLPYLSADPASQTQVSAEWGADSVWLAYSQWQSGNSSQWVYEKTLLKYIFYHNWFSGTAGECGETKICPSGRMSHLFWFGLVAPSSSSSSSENEQRRVSLQVRPESLDTWLATFPQVSFEYQMGSMPPRALQLVTEPWNVSCTVGDMGLYGVSLLAETIGDHVTRSVVCPQELRSGETYYYRPALLHKDQYNDWYFIFYFDRRPFRRVAAVNAILTTCFICVVLLLGSILFTRDANVLVLHPVEKMIAKVNEIRDDPLVASKLADAEFKADELKKSKRKRLEREYRDRGWGWLWRARQAILGESKEAQNMETAILERTIIKLGSLLALGFGEAGCGIVSKNMRDTGAGVNAMIPGKRQDCIIGLARICDFMSLTEVLQTNIMTFVNQIAEIVHGLVDEHQGFCNRNHGETFLLIWRACDWDESRLSQLADMSLVAPARMLGAVHHSIQIARYRLHPALQQRLGKGCRVNLTFGLHFGWAIECAIGSEFKIDASYLSPAVAVTESVERAAKTYGVNCLATDKVISICSRELVALTRLIDKAILMGAREALELYSLDLDYHAVEARLEGVKIPWNVRQRFKARQILEQNKENVRNGEFDALKHFRDIYEVQAMRRRHTVEFLQLYNMGYQNYAQGEWQAARRMLLSTKDMLGTTDGPSAALLAFMAEFDFHAPDDWGGIRPLDVTERDEGRLSITRPCMSMTLGTMSMSMGRRRSSSFRSRTWA